MTAAETRTTIARSQFAKLGNGISLHYLSVGQAGRPLILFLHGFPEYSGAWEEILPHFGDEYHAVAPDLRGYNLSSQPRELSAYRLRAVVEDLVELIRCLGYESAVVVGHDWGGSAAWRLASAIPERVERLVILNAPHPNALARELSGNPAQQAASRHVNWLRSPDMEVALTADDFQRLKDWMRSMPRAGHNWLTPERLHRYVEVWRRGLTGALNYYRASPLHPAPESSQATAALRLSDGHLVKAPTLVCWGMRDESLMPELLNGIEEWVPNVVVERFAAATHWIIHEEPERIARRMHSFLKQPTARAS
jgi:pimeloyl-ACP methyl ester carboxylesterase